MNSHPWTSKREDNAKIFRAIKFNGLSGCLEDTFNIRRVLDADDNIKICG